MIILLTYIAPGTLGRRTVEYGLPCCDISARLSASGSILGADDFVGVCLLCFCAHDLDFFSKAERNLCPAPDF